MREKCVRLRKKKSLTLVETGFNSGSIAKRLIDDFVDEHRH
jgi:hypothetical protein